jgi:hypothetical protein
MAVNGTGNTPLEAIARTNKLGSLSWGELRNEIISKLDSIVGQFPRPDVKQHDGNGHTEPPDTQGDVKITRTVKAEEPVEQYVERIRTMLESMSDPPFTIQRLCELLGPASLQYKTVYKYLRAIEKVQFSSEI